jgi:hypothetical protein
MANSNPDINREYMRQYMLKRYHDRRKKAIDKLGGKCVECNNAEELQFDHIDRNTKKFTIASLSSINEKAFWEEINKCQLLCETCHQKKTLIDLGQKSGKETHGTLSSYRYCKCDLCKEAHNKYTREWKQRKRLKAKMQL